MSFPKWMPNSRTRRRFESADRQQRLRALRSSSSSFISRKDVREYIFKRDGYKCSVCGSDHNLTIDHIRSVYRASKNTDEIATLNDESNLRTLCKTCNSSKRPEE